VTLAIAAGCNNSPEPLKLPTPNEVEGIKAAIWTMWEDESSIEDEFEIPAKYIPAILRTLEPAVPIDQLTHLEKVASLDIRCKNRQTVRIDIEFFGKSPATFTVDGVMCSRDGPYEPIRKEAWIAESLTIGALLRSIRKADVEAIKEKIEELEISAGRRGRDLTR
jgi:hypothetical protein